MTRKTNSQPGEILAGVEKALGYKFRNGELALQALTHSSTGADNYERLEFLGDRVVALVVAETLLEKFPNESEGDIAKRFAALVEGTLLGEIAASIHLGDYISFSSSAGAGNETITSDVFEALIGTIYLDSGLDACRPLIVRLWGDRFENMAVPPSHPKNSVQEWAQGQGLPLPVYKIVGQTGPDHAPVFAVRLSVQGYDDVVAEGRSRQVAEREAARIFLEGLK